MIRAARRDRLDTRRPDAIGASLADAAPARRAHNADDQARASASSFQVSWEGAPGGGPKAPGRRCILSALLQGQRRPGRQDSTLFRSRIASLAAGE